jgi:hypothetical protein
MSAGWRIAARTECPASASSATSARPIKPDAPVTRMRVTVCPDQDYYSVSLPGFWMIVQWRQVTE